MNCGFWFWFTRPFAEFLGAIVMIAGLFVFIFLGALALVFFQSWRAKRSMTNKPTTAG